MVLLIALIKLIKSEQNELVRFTISSNFSFAKQVEMPYVDQQQLVEIVFQFHISLFYLVRKK
jgi:hypothetical protein